MKKIAIIGSGLAGLTVAHHLKNNFKIEIFEKARGVSGRLSTRYATPYQFDHGAQFFTARSPEFNDFLCALKEADIIENWRGTFGILEDTDFLSHKQTKNRYVAKEKMNALGKYLAREHHIHLQTRIAKIEYQAPDSYLLHDENRGIHGPFDIIVSAMPYNQFKDICSAYWGPADKAIRRVAMQGCFSLMLGGEKMELPSFDGAHVKDSIISWIAVNSRKPSRPHAPALVIQSCPDWADEHMDDDRDQVQELLLEELARIMPFEREQIDHSALHGWRYASVSQPLGQAFWKAQDHKLYAIGDWCLGNKVEMAYLSAIGLSNHLEGTL